MNNHFDLEAHLDAVDRAVELERAGKVSEFDAAAIAAQAAEIERERVLVADAERLRLADEQASIPVEAIRRDRAQALAEAGQSAARRRLLTEQGWQRQAHEERTPPSPSGFEPPEFDR